MTRHDTEVLPVAGRLVGNYQLGARLGRGGTSEVFAATHRFLGDPVAIKLMHAQVAQLDQAAGAFLAEARRTRTIQHPNVVRVIDFGRDAGGGFLYLVMEQLAGEDLATRLGRVTRIEEAELRALGAQLADGMAAAHAAGVIHRDLKPANVVLVGGDRPTIVDFGISKHVVGDSALATGPRLGTPAYMAPEQITGTAVGPTTDIWALGALLFEAVTGRLPFLDVAGGRTPQLSESPPLPSSLVPVSPELDALIVACLARDPQQRPATMAEVAARLRGGSAVVARVAAPPAKRRAPWIVASLVGAAGIAAIVTIAVVATAGSRTAMPDAAVPPVAVGAPIDAGETIEMIEPIAPDAAEVANVVDAPVTRVTSRTYVTSMPVGADIVVDGTHAGVTPAIVELAFPSVIEIQRPGYRPSRVIAKRAGRIAVRLVPNTKSPRPRKRPTGETLD